MAPCTWITSMKTKCPRDGTWVSENVCIIILSMVSYISRPASL